MVARESWHMSDLDTQCINSIRFLSIVHLALSAREELAGRGLKARVVSLPSWNLFQEQEAGYGSRVLPSAVAMLAIEAGTPLGWKPYVGSGVEVIGVGRFGASAPGGTLMKEYGFTVENVCRRVEGLLARGREK